MPARTRQEKLELLELLEERARRASAAPQPSPIGTQQLFGQEVSVQQPMGLAELRAGAGKTQTAQPPEDVGATIGEGVGMGVGTLVSPGLGTIVGGVTGAMAGQAIEDFILQKGVRPGRIAAEGGLSLLPEVAEPVVKSLGRAAIRGLPGAKVIRFDEAARRARQALPQVFNPPERQAVAELFDTMRKSGIEADLSELTPMLRSMPDGKYTELLSEVTRIDKQLKTGGRFSELLRNAKTRVETATTVTPPGPGRAFSPQPVTTQTTLPTNAQIGDLQTLRSELRKRAESLGPTEAKQVLRDFQDDIDELIDGALVQKGAAEGLDGDFARRARRLYARARSAEDMTDIVESAITSTPDLAMQSFNLRQLFDQIRRNRTALTKRLNRSLDLTPGARERFVKEVGEIADLAKTIELPLTDVAGIRRNAIVAGIGQMLSTLLLTDTGRRLFRETIIRQGSQMTPTTLALLANAARRELVGTGTDPVPPAPPPTAAPGPVR